MERLRQHREKAVDERLLGLARARVAEDAAVQSLQREAEELRKAEAERRSAIGQTFDVNTLAEANDWMMSCGRKRELAQQKLERARGALVQAQGEVVSAKNDLKKIELVFERLKAKERIVAERVEQRQNDELSAARRANQRRRSEP